MILAKVKGNIVSTLKNKFLIGQKLLLVHPIELNGKFNGKKDIVSLDFTDAGVGDTVLIVQEGDAVQQILGHRSSPVNSIIVAVVDDLEFVE